MAGSFALLSSQRKVLQILEVEAMDGSGAGEKTVFSMYIFSELGREFGGREYGGVTSSYPDTKR